eukprot:3801921-Rhodomonas_salina.1
MRRSEPGVELEDGDEEKVAVRVALELLEEVQRQKFHEHLRRRRPVLGVAWGGKGKREEGGRAGSVW